MNHRARQQVQDTGKDTGKDKDVHVPHAAVQACMYIYMTLHVVLQLTATTAASLEPFKCTLDKLVYSQYIVFEVNILMYTFVYLVYIA